MTSFLGNRIKSNTDINDEIIANTMLGASTAAANAYLNATMASNTPEIRAMLSGSVSQIVTGQSGLMELAVKQGWDKPYSNPTERLTDAYSKSKNVIENK